MKNYKTYKMKNFKILSFLSVISNCSIIKVVIYNKNVKKYNI